MKANKRISKEEKDNLALAMGIDHVPVSYHSKMQQVYSEFPQETPRGKEKNTGENKVQWSGARRKKRAFPPGLVPAVAAAALILGGTAVLAGINRENPPTKLPGAGTASQETEQSQMESSVPSLAFLAEDNETKLLAVDITEAGVLVEFEIPFLGRVSNTLVSDNGWPLGAYAELETEDGTALPAASPALQLDVSEEDLLVGNYENGPRRGTETFQAPPEGVKKLILTFYEYREGFFAPAQVYNANRVTAEFTIDVETGEAQPTQKYLKRGYEKLDSRLLSQEIRHPQLVNGYFVRDISWDPVSREEEGIGQWRVILYREEGEYRPITLTALDAQGNSLASMDSHPASEFNQAGKMGGASKSETGSYMGTGMESNPTSELEGEEFQSALGGNQTEETGKYYEDEKGCYRGEEATAAAQTQQVYERIEILLNIPLSSLPDPAAPTCTFALLDGRTGEKLLGDIESVHQKQSGEIWGFK